MRIIGKENNAYYKARAEAAKTNDRLKSMEGAADALGIHYSTLASYELGTVKCPTPDKVVMMADLYNAPELLNHYCAKECPIGIACEVDTLDLLEFHKVALKTLARLNRSEQIQSDLLEISEDGEITKDEESILEEILLDLEAISLAAQEMKLWAKKRLGGKRSV